MKKKKYLRYEEKVLLLKHHMQSKVSLETLSKKFDINKGTMYNWLRKIDYDFINIEKLRRVNTCKERKSRIRFSSSR